MSDEGFTVIPSHEQRDAFGQPIRQNSNPRQEHGHQHEYWHDEAHRQDHDDLHHDMQKANLEEHRRGSQSSNHPSTPPALQKGASHESDDLAHFRATEQAIIQQQHSQERRASDASGNEHFVNGGNSNSHEEPTARKHNIQTLEQMAFESNYPVPYRSRLTEPFEPGQTLIVKGKTGEDSVRFTINLHSTQADFSGHDVPLHVSVRFDEGKIVCNTFSKGEWGKEERKSNPWKKGDDIDIRIRAHDSKFQIFCDQKELKEYEHRVPLSSISHFSIDGDVLISHIHWGGKYYPVPYESGLANEGLAPGKTLVIYGMPEKKSKRFHINLLKKNGDIALHFNPRFDEKAVVRNSLVANEWGNEEREGKIPFEKATGFDLEIKNEEYAFQVINLKLFEIFIVSSSWYFFTQGEIVWEGLSFQPFLAI
ncbi:hypothetical protein WR25_08585 isoform D [Diploscapter pachys]|uniref:Galectin n=1 Tax=Diploscapter pachys TaxID=2018661 RepID=A0A2A2JL11_9BILA|nr:hypothetical protein WR25_08585 isoform D [Diploscapter pachys]